MGNFENKNKKEKVRYITKMSGYEKNMTYKDIFNGRKVLVNTHFLQEYVINYAPFEKNENSKPLNKFA